MILSQILRLGDASEPTVALGLQFGNRIGLAAGIDRSGRGLVELAGLGPGHVEVGTVTRARDLEIDRSRLPAGFRVGVNFGSSRSGLCRNVIEDYVAMMAAGWDSADFLVANLSSPHAGRTGDTPGIDRLLAELRNMQERLAAKTGQLRPLLIKIPGDNAGDAMPVALVEARRLGFDGVVLVTPDLDRLRAVRDFMPFGEIVSVGGVTAPECIASRLDAGAALVQVHTAFVTGSTTAV